MSKLSNSVELGVVLLALTQHVHGLLTHGDVVVVLLQTSHEARVE
mgnify:CR=1 FL=1